MATVKEAFLAFMLREYAYEKNVFLVAEKVKSTFNCEITPASVRGWYRFFELNSKTVQSANKCSIFTVESIPLLDWLNPNQLLLTMCKELISFREDIKFHCKIEKILYDEIWISYTDSSYKFERRYEVDSTNTKNKLLFQVWWETTTKASFILPILKDITIYDFCFTIQNLRLRSYLFQNSIRMKHIFLIDSRHPLLPAITEDLNADYNILALPPNLSDLAPMNHPFDKLYYHFHEFLRENRYSHMHIIAEAFQRFCRENLDFFQSVFDDFYTCCKLYVQMH
ncbi:hypothetical protein K0M31_010902 [Melipona bicolor]|uniref:Uncharacterized protein n=1 Tax=Melipona bicolor TaxID=60889 RepID=A0AA40FKI0_9HYME|nr:hypothetical protein K0M31_010902 [Melipona bicolor]